MIIRMLASKRPTSVAVPRVDRKSIVLYRHPMGVTYVTARLRRPDGRGPTRNVRFLVDSGAIYSVLPEEIWRALRLKAERQVEFTLADGTPMERGVSEWLMRSIWPRRWQRRPITSAPAMTDS